MIGTESGDSGLRKDAAAYLTSASRGSSLVIYTGARILGGHELMTLRLLEALSKRMTRDGDVEFIAAHDALLNRVPTFVRRRQTPAFDASPLPFLRNLRPDHILSLAAQFRSTGASVALISQGNIEFGLKGLLAARAAGLRTISYLPMAHTFVESGSSFGRARDMLGRLFYRLPHGFVTIASHQAKLLRRFSDAPIYLVRNPIGALPTTLRLRRAFAHDRSAHIAVVGRVYFRQKRQDQLPRIAKLLLERGVSAHFHVFGDGPDTPMLRQMIASAGVSRMFTLHGHCPPERVQKFLLFEADLLLIPSRFEGVPLVFLESVASAVPVVVTPLDFTADYPVPPFAIARDFSAVALAGAVVDTIERSPAEFSELREVVLRLHSEQGFSQDVDELALALLSGSREGSRSSPATSTSSLEH